MCVSSQLDIYSKDKSLPLPWWKGSNIINLLPSGCLIFQGNVAILDWGLASAVGRSGTHCWQVSVHEEKSFAESVCSLHSFHHGHLFLAYWGRLVWLMKKDNSPQPCNFVHLVIDKPICSGCLWCTFTRDKNNFYILLILSGPST